MGSFGVPSIMWECVVPPREALECRVEESAELPMGGSEADGVGGGGGSARGSRSPDPEERNALDPSRPQRPLEAPDVAESDERPPTLQQREREGRRGGDRNKGLRSAGAKARNAIGCFLRPFVSASAKFGLLGRSRKEGGAGAVPTPRPGSACPGGDVADPAAAPVVTRGGRGGGGGSIITLLTAEQSVDVMTLGEQSTAVHLPRGDRYATDTSLVSAVGPRGDKYPVPHGMEERQDLRAVRFLDDGSSGAWDLDFHLSEWHRLKALAEEKERRLEEERARLRRAKIKTHGGALPPTVPRRRGTTRAAEEGVGVDLCRELFPGAFAGARLDALNSLSPRR